MGILILILLFILIMYVGFLYIKNKIYNDSIKKMISKETNLPAIDEIEEFIQVPVKNEYELLKQELNEIEQEIKNQWPD